MKKNKKNEFIDQIKDILNGFERIGSESLGSFFSNIQEKWALKRMCQECKQPELHIQNFKGLKNFYEKFFAIFGTSNLEEKIGSESYIKNIIEPIDKIFKSLLQSGKYSSFEEIQKELVSRNDFVNSLLGKSLVKNKVFFNPEYFLIKELEKKINDFKFLGHDFTDLNKVLADIKEILKALLYNEFLYGKRESSADKILKLLGERTIVNRVKDFMPRRSKILGELKSVTDFLLVFQLFLNEPSVLNECEESLNKLDSLMFQEKSIEEMKTDFKKHLVFLEEKHYINFISPLLSDVHFDQRNADQVTPALERLITAGMNAGEFKHFFDEKLSASFLTLEQQAYIQVQIARPADLKIDAFNKYHFDKSKEAVVGHEESKQEPESPIYAAASPEILLIQEEKEQHHQVWLGLMKKLEIQDSNSNSEIGTQLFALFALSKKMELQKNLGQGKSDEYQILLSSREGAVNALVAKLEGFEKLVNDFIKAQLNPPYQDPPYHDPPYHDHVSRALTGLSLALSANLASESEYWRNWEYDGKPAMEFGSQAAKAAAAEQAPEPPARRATQFTTKAPSPDIGFFGSIQRAFGLEKKKEKEKDPNRVISESIPIS